MPNLNKLLSLSRVDHKVASKKVRTGSIQISCLVRFGTVMPDFCNPFYENMPRLDPDYVSIHK